MSDHDFYVLPDDRIKKKISDEECRKLFMTKYNAARELVASQIRSRELATVDLMETDDQDEILVENSNALNSSDKTDEFGLIFLMNVPKYCFLNF